MKARRDRPPGEGRRPPRPGNRRPKSTKPPGDKPTPSHEGQDRLQKLLAHAGLGSRRSCEELILQGRVTVDGQEVRELGTRVDPVRQRIAVDGQPIRGERPVYYAVNKPKGYVSTNSDPAGRPRVVDLLPEIPERVFTVGRLDEASVGLMILTNDGELANRLAHPRYGVEKVYRAVVAGAPSPDVLEKLVEGVWLAEGKVRARRVKIVGKQGDATVLELILAEGKNREVRRMLARLGHKVMSLTRVRVGPVTLGGMRVGEWRRLSPEEVRRLQDIAAGLPDSGTAARPAQRPSPRPSRPTSGIGTRERRPPRPAAGGPPQGGDRRGQTPAGPPRTRSGPGPKQPTKSPTNLEPAPRRIIGMPGPAPRSRAGLKPKRKPPVRPGGRAPMIKRAPRRPRDDSSSEPAE